MGSVVQLEGDCSFSSVLLRRIKATCELVLLPKSVFMLAIAELAADIDAVPADRAAAPSNAAQKLSSSKSAAVAGAAANSSQQGAERERAPRGRAGPRGRARYRAGYKSSKLQRRPTRTSCAAMFLNVIGAERIGAVVTSPKLR